MSTEESKAMTKTQLADHLAKKCGITKVTAQAVMAELVAVACQEASKGFTIPGLGKIVLIDQKERQGRNPQTGATITIPAKKVVKFRIAKACKDAILGV